MALLFFLALTITASPAGAENEQVLRVGVILPLTGDAASVGIATRNGMELAMRHLKPKARSRLRLSYEDDQLSSKQTLSAYHKLRASGGADVVVNISSGTAKALAPLVERDNVPLVAIASDPQVSRSRRFVVNLWVTPEEEAKFAVEEALRRGYRRVARVVATQDGMLALRQAFDAENAGRIALVLDEEYPPDLKEYRSFIARLRALPAVDAISIMLMPGQCGTFAKQVRDAGVPTPFFGFELFEDSNEVKASAGALLGQWYVNAADPDLRFLKSYREAYAGASEFLAANGYDAVLLLAKATEESVDPERVNVFLHTVKDFRGALGTYSASGDNRFTLPAAVKEVAMERSR